MAILNIAQLKSNVLSESGESVELTTKSNIVTVNNLSTDVSVLKSSEKIWATPNSTIKVTTTITNNTNVNLENFSIKDTLGNFTSFVEGSVTVGTQSYPDFNPVDGFTLPVTIGVGAEADISYNVKISEYIDEDTTTNKSTVTVNIEGEIFNLDSNTLTINILNNGVVLTKTVSKIAVKSGEEITYTIKITNSGTLKNTNVKFVDEIPQGTSFVTGSVVIDGEGKQDLDPSVGFTLNDLDVGDTITVEFKVTVD